ncbi:MAG: transcription repressor NadR [Clostridia bacterium]|nr:transcription repressor NadR [Clostridia bacterium]
MKADERRKAIIDTLRGSEAAVNGTALADKFGVSRQIVVSDISALKAEGYDIRSTHSGYLLPVSELVKKTFKLRHTKEQTEDELSVIVSFGGRVENVYVWHKVYGRIEAPLSIASREDIENFMEGVRSGKSTELMNITGGYHYHTVSADSRQTLDNIENALTEKGYIAPEI